MDSLTFISYNCQSFRQNMNFVRILLQDCQILLLQETLLPEHAFHMADSLSDDSMEFDFSFVPSTRDETSFSGRSSGGLAFVWLKHLTPFIEILSLTDRIHGLKLKCQDKSFLILNIYCPCDYKNFESKLQYQSVMADLRIVCLERHNEFDELIIAGDWNADPSKGRFFMEMSSFIDEFGLSIADVVRLPPDSHTYVSCNTSCSTSWIDHIVTSDLSGIGDVTIMYGETFFDHIPVKFKIESSVPLVDVASAPLADDRFVPWHSLSEANLITYRESLDELSKNLILNTTFCNDNACNNLDHRNELNLLYHEILSSIFKASDHMFVSRSKKCFKNVPGWNKYCKELHAAARQHYLCWMDAGRPRCGHLFENMKISRSAFKKSLMYCKNNKKQICKQNLADAFAINNKCRYWKEVI